jgi:hypothetical protein
MEDQMQFPYASHGSLEVFGDGEGMTEARARTNTTAANIAIFTAYSGQ